MATWIAQGIEEKGGFDVELMDIEFASLGEMESAVTRSDALIVGSPTINKNALLPIYKLFAAINPLRDKDKAAAAFGSYGWSGEAADLIEANLSGLKLKIVQKAFKNKFSPDEEKAQRLIEFGKSFAEQLQKGRTEVLQ
jgi:flavorubredoxin